VKKRTDRWIFVDSPRKPLTREEVLYWKNVLSKTLKVGIEFEFNLKKPKGDCDGTSAYCLCINHGDGCWNECGSMKACSSVPSPVKCSNRNDDCNKNCSRCADFEFKCLSAECPLFVTKCLSCKKYAKNCKLCEHYLDLTTTPNSIRRRMRKKFKPTGDYGHLSASGIHEITTDGSLVADKGVEIITAGRRANFAEFYKMSKNVIDEALANNAYVNERCSTHMHVLASYYNIGRAIRELERSVPEIILANLLQLCRRYQNEITWMTMALNDYKHLTRWEKFRLSVLDYSALTMSIPQMLHSMRNNIRSKYAWINYDYTTFNDKYNIETLHIEFRAADGILSPTAVAAIACLYHALVIKAVEISRYGVIELSPNFIKRAKTIKKVILNNTKDYADGDRKGYTSELGDYIDELRENSFELIGQLKHILYRLGPVYDVLTKLAEKPIALLRAEGRPWEEIEEHLQIEMQDDDEVASLLQQYVDLQLVSECGSPEEWAIEVTNDVKSRKLLRTADVSRIREIVDSKVVSGEYYWEPRLGAFINI